MKFCDYKQRISLYIFLFTNMSLVILAGNGFPYTETSGIISENTTWTKAKSPYIVTDGITVRPPKVDGSVTTLTIEPGVEVRFQPGAFLNIGDADYGYFGTTRYYGCLKAIGTETEPILFTSNSTSPKAGDWKGINSISVKQDAVTELKHCVIEYGGEANSSAIDCRGSFVIENCTVRFSSGHGIGIWSGAAPTIMQCIIAQNKGDGIHNADGNASVIDCTISNNDGNGVICSGNTMTIRGNDIAENLEHGILCNNGSPTVNNNLLTSNSEAAITVKSGVDISNFYKNTASGNGRDCLSIMAGNLGSDKVWKKRDGLPYVVEGGIGISGPRAGLVTLTIEPGVEVRFQPGAFLNIGDADYGYFGTTRYYGCLKAIGTETEPILFTSNSTSPKAGDWKGINSISVKQDAVTELKHCVIEYGGEANSSAIDCRGSFVIENCTVRFSSGHGIGIWSGAAPTIMQCIIAQNKGDGIHNADGNASVIDCTISNNDGNGVICSGNTMTIRGNDIAENLEHGILCNNGSPTVNNNLLTSNSEAAITVKSGVDISNFYKNTASGNGRDCLSIMAGNLGSDKVWKKRDGLPYVVEGGIGISGPRAGLVTLTIEPGVEVRFQPGAFLNIGDADYGYFGTTRYYGCLKAIGTETEPILFTSNLIFPKKGSWQGINTISPKEDFSPELKHCIIEYAGDENSSAIQSSGSDIIENCTVRFSAGNGISIDSSNELSNCIVSGNDGHGIVCYGTPTILFSQIINNGKSGIYVSGLDQDGFISNCIISGNEYGVNIGYKYSSEDIINAQDNYWGHPSGPYDPSDDTATGGLFNPNGQGDEVSDGVIYDPWKFSADDSEGIPLTAGIPFDGTINPGETVNFQFAGQSGKALLIEVIPKTGVNELFLSEETENLNAQDLTLRGTYELPIAPTSSNSYLIALFGANIAAGGGEYRITAKYVQSPYLTHLSNNFAGNNGNITLTLTGLNLTNTTPISLKGYDGFVIFPAYQQRLSSTELSVTFELNGATPDMYDVIAKNGNTVTSTLEGAFQVIEETQPGRVLVTVEAPEAVRRARKFTCWVNYRNDGSTDVQAPLLVISNSVNAPMRLSDQEPFQEGSIQILAVNMEGPAGILPPGFSGQIPIYFQVPNNASGSIEFTVEKMTADDTSVDWDALETEIRPTDMQADAWQVIWSNFTAQMGVTWKEYLNRLCQDATYIGLNRKTSEVHFIANELWLRDIRDTQIYDVRKLLQFEIAKASGSISPRSVLGAAQDIYLPAPGLSLSFGRFFPHSIDHRHRLGAFGRGWVHTYEYRASIEDNGDIHIEGPGGSLRVFYLLDDSSYMGTPGDYGEVAVSGSSVTIKEKNGVIWEFDETGRPTTIEDLNGNRISLFFSGDDLVQIAHSNGDTINLVYNGAGYIQEITDAAGRTTFYRYDANREHLVEVEYPGGIITQYAYNSTIGSPSAHALTKITFPDGTYQSYAYDGRGRVSAEWGVSDSGHVDYTYDNQGVVTISDALGNNSLIRYGLNGEILQIQDPTGALVRNVYDPKSQVAQLIGPDGKKVSVAYDGMGNSVGVNNPMNQNVLMKYDDAANRITSLTDARLNETQFSYDPQGNLESIIYPDASVESFGYDQVGNAVTYTNRRGQTMTYSYNARGQLTRKVYLDGRTMTYQYDGRGNLISANDTLTGEIVMAHDNRDFLTRIEYPGGYWFTFEYNNAGQRSNRTGHDGYVLNYAYDEAGRLSGLTDGNGVKIIEYEYDANGFLQAEYKGNGTQTTYDYDAAGQLVSMVNWSPGGMVQSRFDYTYDVNGNRTAMTTLDGTTQYQYDDIGQLTGVTYPDGRETEYIYDAAGNRIRVTDNGVSTEYTTNNMNQYTQMGDATYRYDNDGNMISKTDAEGITTYEYDGENRLIRVVIPSEGTWSFIYDALGNRIAVDHNGILNSYVHDPYGLTNIAAEFDSYGNLISRYLYGYGIVSNFNESDNLFFYSFDAIGNTVGVTNDTGDLVNIYHYSPFGVCFPEKEGIPNIFKYVGRFGVVGQIEGIYYMRERYYSKDIGRFIQQDPVSYQDSLNLYTYVKNDPLLFIDPNGTSGKKPDNKKILKMVLEWIICDIMPWGVDDVIAWKNISDTIAEEYPEIQPIKDVIDLGPAGIGKKLGEKLIEKTTKQKEGENDFLAEALELEMLPDKAISDNLVDSTIILVNKDKISSDKTMIIAPIDPNEKLGSSGLTDQHYIIVKDELLYSVYFENKSSSTASAQEVFIIDDLDENLDFSTFQLGEVGFGDQVVSDLKGKATGKTRLVLDDLAVDIEVQTNPDTHLIKWTLRTIDLETGELPEDVYAGFLPPEDGTGRGQGYVTFSVKTKPDLPSGTRITNKASIVFDTEAPIITNEVFNTITDAAPAASTEPFTQNGAMDVSISTILSWAATDYATGYDVYLWKAGSAEPFVPIANDLPTHFYEPLALEYGTTYNWRVSAKNVMGESPGPIWSFTTESQPDYTLRDAVMILQLLTGLERDVTHIADVDGDNPPRIGLPETIYLLQKAANMR